MKKGFTLIELLAVIVILAIIALIASPTIMGLIDDAKKEAFKNTAYGIIKAGEYTYSTELLNGQNNGVTFTYTDGVETSSVEGKKLKYTGSKPNSGQIIVNSEGKVAIAIHNGKFCVIKTYSETEITLLEIGPEECIIPSYADNSGAPSPELSTGMIPIIYNGTKWVKADINVKWYDYDLKEWANAVLVTEATRNTYQNANPGTEILEEDILAYLVWIPRYRYKLFNVAAISMSAQTIEIEFESKNTNKSTGSTNGTWLTHPAFTFGTSETNGFWVGKFETTGDVTTPTVKPDIPSLKGQNISTQFSISQKFNNSATYGSTSDFDAHMMKNMEWGAVAFLSHSKYGINDEVYLNNSSDFITGRSGGNVGGSQVTVSGYEYINTGYYTYDGKCATTTMIVPGIAPECTAIGNELIDKTKAYRASTTGNIYGIYDMSGGTSEHVMGAMYNSDNSTIYVYSSGFAQATIDSTNMAKYINKYTYGTSWNDQAAYNRRQLGDAMGEARGWHGDYAHFTNNYYPWMGRGGYYSSGAYGGIFDYDFRTGEGGNNKTFRLVQLKVQE